MDGSFSAAVVFPARAKETEVTFSIPLLTRTRMGSFPNQIKEAIHKTLLHFSLGSAVMEAIADYTPSTSQKTSHLNPNFPEA